MKRSIYCSDPIERLLEQRAEDHSGFRSVSGVLNACADRYLEIVRRSMPTLRVEEWALIFDSMNGVWMQDQAGMLGGALGLGIRDSISLDGLDKKHEVDGDALLAKLDALTYCQQVAVVDAAERFWAAPNEGETLRDTITAVVGERCIDEAVGG